MFKQQSVTDITKEYEQEKAKVKNRFYSKLVTIVDNNKERLRLIEEARITLNKEEGAALKDHADAQVAINDLLKD